jgi:hypothetical protein
VGEPDETNDTPAGLEDSGRQAWHEGPDEEAPAESWLGLGDDELLHRVETLEPDADADAQLTEIVRSHRHFFIRQEAAKRVKDKSLLFAFEDDRHVGQILVRYLTRREDVTYLERLVARSHNVEVRAAAQVQLAQLWGRLGGPRRTSPADPNAPPAPQFSPPTPSEEEIEIIEVDEDTDGVNGSLLAWAIHFLVERTWPHLGTRTARDLLTRTHAGILPLRPALSFFKIEENAQVNVDLSLGTNLPRESVGAVAAWMMAFLDAAQRVEPEMGEVDVRRSTRLMGDALQQAGFYEACEGPERLGPRRLADPAEIG